jgi:glycosyltransferase involved in cell wall biosynthesis
MNISVVIPLYNKEKYILRTITSVLNQTVSPAEIIVIDDGSTDNSAREVEKIIDNRIHLVRQKNAGEGAARNRGVLEANCDLIAFLDADDEWKPSFLETVTRMYNNFPDCGAYATSYEILTSKGEVIHPYLEGIPPEPWIGLIPNFVKMSQHGSPLSSSSVVIPKKIFTLLGGFPEKVTQGADRMMWFKLGIRYPIAISSSSQAIYHTEATDRACYAYVREPETANLIDEMLKNNEIPIALKQDVYDYCAYLKIEKAKHRIKAGEPKLARDLLITQFSNRKYRNKAIRWYLWGMIPTSVIKTIIRGKS